MHILIKRFWINTAIDILLAVLPVIARALTKERRKADGRQISSHPQR